MLFSALAGLTYFLRLQVVTFIMGGRRFSNSDSSIFGNSLENLSEKETFEDRNKMEKVSLVEKSPFGCYFDFGVCLSYTVIEALKEGRWTEREIIVKVSNGFAEYFIDGQIKNTWKRIGDIPHVQLTIGCIKNLNSCLG